VNTSAVPSAELDRLRRLGWSPAEHGTLREGIWRVGEAGSVNYPTEGFAAIEPGSGASYWFDHRADEVAEQLHRLSCASLWEIGAGSGAMSHRLERKGFEVVAVEPLIEGARAIAERSDGPVFCGLVDDLHLPSGSLPAVGVFDVLEHLDHPDLMLAELHRILAPGGLLFVTVPALSWLWSDEDDVAGHQVRYTRRTLTAAMAEAGFAELHSAYLYASLVAPAAAIRAVPYRLGRRRSGTEALAALDQQLDPPPAVDKAVRSVLRGESRLARRLRLPIGTSLLGVYRRPL